MPWLASMTGKDLFYCVLLGSVLTACAHTPPAPSLGDFTDVILTPLAVQHADESIIEIKAKLGQMYQARLRQLTGAQLTPTEELVLKGLSSVLFGPGGAVGSSVLFGVLRSNGQRAMADTEAEYQDWLIWLDTRRAPLKADLLALYIKRTKPTGTGFSVCIDGQERRYEQVDIRRYSRVEDGPGPCERIRLGTLPSLRRDAIKTK